MDENIVNFYRSKRVLVTGGASFIGSRLVEMLVEAGAQTHVADNFSSGKRENLQAVRDDIEVHEVDLRDPVASDKAANAAEIVFHLASSHGGRGYIDTHPVECSTNMILDGVVFAAAHRAQVERICFASSACVYPTHLQEESSDGGIIHLSEEMADPHSARGCASDGEYGWAKLMAEMTLQAYHKQYGIQGVLCRIFTAYGERENETHAIIALIARAFVKQDPYVIWGTGRQKRNFTYVDDVVDGLMIATAKISDATAINIGAEECIAVKDVADLIFENTSFRPERIELDETKPVGVFDRTADLNKARSVLNWEPRTSLEEGLQKTIKWYFETHDAAAVAKELNTLLTER